jgi:hypothetical protein
MERSKSLDLPRKLVAFDHEPARKSMHLTRVPDSRKSLHLHDSRKSIQLHRVQPTREESVDFTKKAIKFADAQCLPLGLVFAVLAGLTLSHIQSLSLSIFPSRHHSGVCVCVCVSVCLLSVWSTYLHSFSRAHYPRAHACLAPPSSNNRVSLQALLSLGSATALDKKDTSPFSVYVNLKKKGPEPLKSPPEGCFSAVACFSWQLLVGHVDIFCVRYF